MRRWEQGDFGVNNCFVMMPFGGDFDDYYSGIIKPSIESAGLKSVRADEIYSSGAIVADIHRAIHDARICLADVSGKNPNVSYELGVAHALMKPVIIIAGDTSDVPFDYRHLRVIIYSVKDADWREKLSAAILNTIAEVLKDPNEHLALKPLNTDLRKSLSHLIKVFFDLDCELEKIDDIYCDEASNAVIKTRWNVKPLKPAYHFCHNIVTERVGAKIEIRRIYDKLSGRDLDHVVLERGERHVSYMILLKQFKPAGQSFVVETDLFVEGYMDGLFSNGEVTMTHQAAQHSGVKYRNRVERYHFAKAPKYSAISAKFLSHPTSEKTGTTQHVVEQKDAYVLELIYDADHLYRQETGAVIRVS
jgi:hypothetical protein